MKVSIVTISFNSELTINKTIESVAMQDYKDIEYIIVDGNSTDNTDMIVKSYGSKIQKYIRENDNGLYDAMNKGIKNSSGEVIGFINSDDFLESKTIISEVVETFKKTKTDIVFGDKKYVDRFDISKTNRYWAAGEFSIAKFKHGWMPPHLSTYIKKEIYTKFGLFRSDLKIAADYELLLRFIVKNKIKPIYLPKVIAVMRSGGVSNSSIKNRLISLYEVYKSWRINKMYVSPLIMIFKPLRKVFQFSKLSFKNTK